jgi:O-antigen ligase
MERIITLNGSNVTRVAGSRHRVAFAGLFLFTLLLYARPNEAFPEVFGQFPLAKIVAIVSLLAYLTSHAAYGERLTIWPLELKMILVIALLGVAFIPVAAAPGDSINLLMDIFLKVAAIFVLMINLLDTRERLRSILRLVVICGTVLALFAISNYLAGKFLTTDKRIGIRIAGVVGGVFENPNDLATSLVLLIPPAVALALLTRRAARAAWLACATVLAMAVVLTFSRGGFLGLIAMVVVLLWKLLRRNGAATILAAALMGGVFLVAMPSGYSSRLTSIFDSESDPTGSVQARRDLLQRAASVAASHPIVGVGMGNFHIYSIREQKAHNSYLEIAAELGLIGLIAYLAMLFAPLRSLRRIERDSIHNASGQSINGHDGDTRRETYYLGAAFQASLIAYMVCSFFGSIQYLWFVYYPLAYAVSLRRIHESESPQTGLTNNGKSSIGALWNQRNARPFGRGR